MHIWFSRRDQEGKIFITGFKKGSRGQNIHIWFSRRDQEGKICVSGFQEAM